MGWHNADGLYLPLGTEEATPGIGGETNISGDMRELVFNIADLTELTDASAILGNHNIWLPKNARIEAVEVLNTTAATSGGSATLNVGLIRTDRSTAYDADGLVAALALASFNSAGEKVTLTTGVTSAGALIGTTLANNGLIVADYDTAAFTAGAVRIRVKYFFA